jgi:hypothetical protein
VNDQWFKLYVESNYCGWTSKINLELYGVWVRALGVVKRSGVTGSVTRRDLLDHLAPRGVTGKHLDDLLAAATPENIREDDGIITFVNWEAYQGHRPKTDAERAKDYRDRKRVTNVTLRVTRHESSPLLSSSSLILGGCGGKNEEPPASPPVQPPPPVAPPEGETLVLDGNPPVPAKKRGKTAPKQPDAPLVFPKCLDIPQFRDVLWPKYIAHRQQKKSPLTGPAQQAQLDYLGGQGLVSATFRVNRTLEGGWMGLYFSSQPDERGKIYTEAPEEPAVPGQAPAKPTTHSDVYSRIAPFGEGR